MEAQNEIMSPQHKICVLLHEQGEMVICEKELIEAIDNPAEDEGIYFIKENIEILLSILHILKNGYFEIVGSLIKIGANTCTA